jgi:hypothetical protein
MDHGSTHESADLTSIIHGLNGSTHMAQNINEPIKFGHKSVRVTG